MSAPGPFGQRPARLAAFGLIGVAVVALGLGVFSVVANSASQSAQGHPPTPPTSSTGPATSPHPTTATPTRPPTHPTTAAPTTSYPSGQTTTVAPPPQPGTTGGQPGQVSVPQVGVRVYNNSMIVGLAQRAAADLRAAGFNVVLVGSYSQGIIPTTTAYYSPAPGEQAVATQIGQQFGMQVRPRFPGIAFASPGVIVIVTNDFQSGGKK